MASRVGSTVAGVPIAMLAAWSGGEALADVLHAHKSLEDFVHECEDLNRDSLLTQRKRSERGFREGRFTTWDEIKHRHDL
jgi:hypothetical protein